MYKILRDPPQLEHDGLTFSLDYCEPTEFAKSVAKEELRETPENVENGLNELRRLLEDEPHLHCPLDNDLWLLSFLRPAHFYPDGALKIIKDYFNYRQKFPDLCKDLKLQTVYGVLHDYNGSMLPKRDQHGRRLFVSLQGKYWDTEKVTKESLLQSFIVQCEYFRSEPETQISGIVIILDVDGLTMDKVLRFTPYFAKSLINYLEEGMGIRLKGYHIVNNPKIFDIVFALCKRFMNKKLSSRVHFHRSDMTSLHRYISPDCLPECYGGTLKTCQQSHGPQFYKLLEKYENDYDKFQEYGLRNKK
uniref:CRAL/TRIO domain protein n=1 Tax=Musca domestica TaxID=7370 RepID=T1PA79_MUSDO